MNNASKYSKADLACLSLKGKDGRIELVIEDNGVGFNLEKKIGSKNQKRGLGLASMKERAELSGRVFSIESVEGKGTTVKTAWRI